jgi:DNA-directed RNA polymerase sigma subunit (sigma70/sigma32)
METPLETYRRIVAEQPVCEANWFADALGQYRAGDEAAARNISGSCLRFALQMAEERAADTRNCQLFDLIEEANGGLMEAITTYNGSDFGEFLQFAQQKITDRLNVLARA